MMPALDIATAARKAAWIVGGLLGAALLCVPAGNTRAHALRPAASADSTGQRPALSSERASGPAVGIFVQTVLHAASGPTAAPEGFHVPRARLGAEGHFESIAYEVEADFADDVLLQDARVVYRPTAHLALGAGRFKVPFSYGELVSSAATDFVQRPRVARQLSVGRRTGVDVAYQAWDGRVRVQGGVFSGESAPDAAEEWVSAARLTGTIGTGSVRGVVGANAAYVQHTDGGHTRYGLDGRVMRGPAFLTAEVLAAPTAPAATAMGAYVTAGYALTDAHLVRAQWDYVSGDAPAGASGRAASSHALIGVGYTLRLAAPLRIEVDYLVPPAAGAFDRSAVFVNVQISL